MVTLTDSDIPLALQRLPQPPKQLFVEGGLSEMLARPRVGIVGSRKVSPYGRQVTERLARELAGRGVVIISGLALGVDSVAHRAALDAGGLTAAVLPGPLERIYPASHRQLAGDIVRQGGVLLSEYPAGSNMFRSSFVARNRLIAGLSDVLIVTEAGLKSGSLHTARFALEQGKEVLAVPGNITSETSVGTNNLLKSGAGVLTDSTDVFQRLGLTNDAATASVIGDTEAEQVIIDLIRAGTSDGNELHARSGLDIALFSQSLTMLELSGKIRALGGNQWSL